MKKRNAWIGTISGAVATAGLVSALGLPADFAASGSANGTTSNPWQAVVGPDLTTAATYMNTKGAAKLPFWTEVADYAATGTFAKHTWKASDFAGLKAGTDYAKAILGVLATGQDPHQVAGVDLVSKLAASQLTSGDNEGKFADNIDGTGTDLINNQAWTIIALEDAGGANYNRAEAALWLIQHQNQDGGFGYSTKYSSSDPDDTASAIIALRLLGFSADSKPVVDAVQYLQSQQAADGGMMNGSKSGNSDSTGVTLDALASIGVAPTAKAWQAKDGNLMISLMGDYDQKSGGFKYDNSGSSWSGVSAMSTRDAIFGLAATKTGESVYQRLEAQQLTQLNPYWSKIYAAGGAWFNHQWKPWSDLRSMALAGSYVTELTPQWQAVMKAHGMKVQSGSKTVWQAWGPQLANEALQQSFGLDTVHLNLLS